MSPRTKRFRTSKPADRRGRKGTDLPSHEASTVAGLLRAHRPCWIPARERSVRGEYFAVDKNTPRMSVTRRSFLAKAAAASVVGPAIVASSGRLTLFSSAHAESEDHSRRHNHLRLFPSSVRRKVETEHHLTARLYPPEAGETVEFLVMFGPNAGVADSAVTGADGRASFSYTGGPDEGADFILAWVDDGDLSLEMDEAFAIALVRWQLTHPIDKLLVFPRSGESLIGTEHTVTATVIPTAPGIPIIFTIVSGPHAGPSEIVETDESGTASFSYIGTDEGADMIAVLADANSSGGMDAGELVAMAKRNWVIELSGDESESAESDESGESSESAESESGE